MKDGNLSHQLGAIRSVEQQIAIVTAHYKMNQ